MGDVSSEPEYEDLRDSLDAAVGRVLQQRGEFVTKWIVIAETVGAEDNARGVWMATNKGATAWDNKGLLRDALDREAAATVWDLRPEGD